MMQRLKLRHIKMPQTARLRIGNNPQPADISH